MSSLRLSHLLAAALDEARSIAAVRDWSPPGDATLAEAQRLLGLVEGHWPTPEVQVEPDGAVTLTWEQDQRGWLSLAVRGEGTVEHGAVILGDDYAQVEAFGDVLPDWACVLLHRLLDDPAASLH